MIRGTFERKDMQAAAWVHLRPRRGLLVAGLALLALLTWAAWISVFGDIGSGWVRWILPGILLYFAFMFLVWLPYHTGRIFKQRKDLQREVDFEFSDAGLTARTENAYGNKPWADYLKWKEGKHVFLLYLSDNMYQVVPKRFFESDDQISQLRTLLRNNVKRGEA